MNAFNNFALILPNPGKKYTFPRLTSAGCYPYKDYDDTFVSIEEAKVACLYDDKCKGMQNYGCDDKQGYRLCKEISPKTANGYCFYNKTGSFSSS